MTQSQLRIAAEDGGSFAGYLSTADGGRKPGLVICTEVFGVNSHMRSVADRFAASGFATLVPDLFWRIEPGMEIAYDEAGLKRGLEILRAFDLDRGVADLGKAVALLRARPECDGRVGVVGFCLGGAVAYLAAARLAVDAAVSYYGKGIEDRLDEASRINCPLLLHFAGADRFIPQEVVARIGDAIGDRPNVAIHVYPGVDHGFNSEDRRAYDRDAAGSAMERTLATLQAALGR